MWSEAAVRFESLRRAVRSEAVSVGFDARSATYGKAGGGDDRSFLIERRTIY